MSARRRTARRRPVTALVGGGGLARAFLPGLLAAGYPVRALAARTLGSARRAIAGRPGIRATSSALKAARGAELILLAVPDRELAGLARVLAQGLKGRLERCVVLHHAGALGLEPLQPLARARAAVGVLHPLQSLAPRSRSASLLVGAHARVEGDRRAAALARRLARDLGLKPFSLRAGLSASDRGAYHAAASLASNDLVALLSLAVRLMTRIGLEPGQARAALVPLARGTLAQIEREGLAHALTGPVVRGDADTLAAQLRRLRGLSGEAADVHRLLALELLGIARASRRLSPAQTRALRRALRAPAAGRGRRAGV